MHEMEIKVSGLSQAQKDELLNLIKKYGVKNGATVTWCNEYDSLTTHCAVHKGEKKE